MIPETNNFAFELLLVLKKQIYSKDYQYANKSTISALQKQK